MRLVSVPSISPEEVPGTVAGILSGEEVLLFGGPGPLLAALHLSRFDAPVEGPPLALLPGLAPAPPGTYWPVTGVGYALWRCAGQTVAVYGPRGEGALLFVGCESAEDPLLRSCLDWFSGKSRLLVRSKEGEQ